ncbi:MAG TPA: threonine--tRNA ligase [Mogibacterium sp.]|nr:threonine--tRNA ligase [Mogibacterium sp.]
MAKYDFTKKEDREKFRHTSSHVLAQAIKRIWPEAKLAIGPAIDNGFYYDIDLDYKITEKDLLKIQKEMKKIVKANYKLEKFELPRDEAIEFEEERNEDYKVELIKDLPEDAVISFYKQGEFIDLCAGPHAECTGDIKAIKLTSIAGAYWRGDSNKKMLQRIYGVSFPTQAELDEYLKMIEEAKKRDHRKIGREMDLFMLSDYGPGFPFFLPNGMILRNELEAYWCDLHKKYGYDEIKTPLILNKDLWLISGHWGHYRDNMYFTEIDEKEFAVKPMNCPGAILAYKRKMWSYRDMPIRVAERGQVHRHELSGALHGLMRVRTFTQDDAHIFMLPEQIKDEIKEVIKCIDEIYSTFGFEYRIELSTRPEDFMGEIEDWDFSEKMLKEAIEEVGKAYELNPGDGAFYGPKIDFHLKDCIGRTWQCGTIQLDMQMPNNFDITYVGSDGEKHRPVMIHTAKLGSIERFIGILIENTEGKFPLWMAPVQVKLLTVTDAQKEYAENVAERCRQAGLRVETDLRNEKIGYKLREARNARDSYICVIGDKEVADDTLSVRSSKEGELGVLLVGDFIAKLQEEIKSKAL